MDPRRRVVVSGMGCVSPFGIGVSPYRKNLFAGKTAARMIDTFDTEGLPTRFAAYLPMSDEQVGEFVRNQRILRTLSRAGMFAVIAAQEAADQAGLSGAPLDPFRFGTSLGSGGLGIWDLDHGNQMAELTLQASEGLSDRSKLASRMWGKVLEQVHPLSPLKALSNIPTAHIAIEHNARGVCQTITTACTSSAQAIGEAVRQIRWGLADVMMAGGSDSMVNPNGLVAFSMLGVLSKNNDEFASACRPFDKRRDGFMIGEGAAMFVLEEREHCLKRGAVPLAEIAGYANTCDAYRLTDEPEEAWGSIHAIKGALADAGYGASEIDYVNAHGTGTRMNDITESFAIRTGLGGSSTPPVSSTKSMIGHLVAAAGAVECAACILAMQEQRLPPTINLNVPDPDCPLDYVPNESRPARVRTAMSNSFGFGGQNACLVLRSEAGVAP